MIHTPSRAFRVDVRWLRHCRSVSTVVMGVVAGGLLTGCVGAGPARQSSGAATAASQETATELLPTTVSRLSMGDFFRAESSMLPVGDIDPTGGFELINKRTIGAYVLRAWGEAGGLHQATWPTNQVVTITEGRNTLLEVPTGRFDTSVPQDITGDGIPEVVIHTISGGNACCQSTRVYQLGDDLTAILDTPQDVYCWTGLTGHFEDLDDDSVFEFITCATGTFDIGDCSYYWHMESSKPKAILRYVAGQGYVPAGPQFADQYEEDIASLRSALGAGTTEYACPVIHLALTYLLAGRTTEGWAVIDNHLSAEEATDAKRSLAAELRFDPMYVAPGDKPQPVLWTQDD